MKFVESDWDEYPYVLVDFSFTTLLTMTTERYLALAFPFFHQKFMTKPRLIALFLLYQLPLGCLCALQVSKLLAAQIYYAIFGVLFFSVCILNFKLFYIARTMRKRGL